MDFEKKQTGATSREDFASNEEQVATKKQAIAEAVAAGDYDKVAELAQEAKRLEGDKQEMMNATQEAALAENAERDMATKKEGDHAEALEMNKAFDESQAAEAVAKEKARIAEEDKLKAEADAAAATKLAEQIKGGGIVSEERPVVAGQEKIADGEAAAMQSMVEAAKLARRGDPQAQEAYRAVWQAIPENIRKAPGFKDRVTATIREDSAKRWASDNEEALIENADRESGKTIEEKIGAPKTEMFQKYGSRMREASSELVGVKEKMRANREKIDDRNLDMTERKRAQGENDTLNDQRNRLLRDADFGAEVIRYRSKKSDESYEAYERYKRKEMDEYERTAMQDPVIVMNLAKAGEFGTGYRENEGVGKIDRKLRGNPEFMMKVLEALPSSRAAESFSAHTYGLTPQHRELYIAAVKKNHLNYQFGPKEWTTDPEIQKIALASGLDERYLEKQ